MRYGVVYPQTQLGADPVVMRDFVQAAEGMGYHHLLAYDHVLGANPDREGWEAGRPYTYKDTFHEPFTLFAWMAALTERIGFMTGVLILPQRQTALVAKQAAQVDFAFQRPASAWALAWAGTRSSITHSTSTSRRVVPRVEEQITISASVVDARVSGYRWPIRQD